LKRDIIVTYSEPNISRFFIGMSEEKVKEKKDSRVKIFTKLYDTTSTKMNKFKKSISAIGDSFSLKRIKSKQSENRESEYKESHIDSPTMTNSTMTNSESVYVTLDLDLNEMKEIKHDVSVSNDNVTIVPNEQLDQLLQDITDIKEMSKDMSGILDGQNISLQKIEENVDNAIVHLDEGSKNLDQALKNRNDGFINVAGVGGGALIGSIFGPVGAATGMAIGLISSLTINKVR